MNIDIMHFSVAVAQLASLASLATGYKKMNPLRGFSLNHVDHTNERTKHIAILCDTYFFPRNIYNFKFN